MSTPTTRSRRSAEETRAKPLSSSTKRTASAGRSSARYPPMARADPSVTFVPNVESCVDASARPKTARDSRGRPKTASSRSRRTSARCDASSPASLSATSHRPSAHRRLSLVSSLNFDSSGRSAARPIRRMARAARSARVSPPEPEPASDFQKGSRRREHRRRYASRRSRERHAAMASARAPWPTSSKVSRAVGVAKMSREKCRASEAAAETRVATPEPRHAPAYALSA